MTRVITLNYHTTSEEGSAGCQVFRLNRVQVLHSRLPSLVLLMPAIFKSLESKQRVLQCTLGLRQAVHWLLPLLTAVLRFSSGQLTLPDLLCLWTQWDGAHFESHWEDTWFRTKKSATLLLVMVTGLRRGTRTRLGHFVGRSGQEKNALSYKHGICCWEGEHIKNGSKRKKWGAKRKGEIPEENECLDSAIPEADDLNTPIT